ncbi:MAG: serine/threonine protein kinase [Myxococcales bacterium]|nr:serine/threonine protein kinase [Myxococcales bacterium]
MQPADDALPVLGGRFQLIRPIGQGGFATVYQALDQRLDKNVAVKVLNQRFAAHEEYRKRFIQEAKAAARVSHPLLVDVSDIGGTDDGRLYFVMEYLEGCTLSEHLREHPGGLPWREAMVIALEIVKALEVAHRHDIVHRDVKPGNVFLKGGITRGPELQIKLLDLGSPRSTTRAATRSGRRPAPTGPWGPLSTWRQSRSAAAPTRRASTSTRSAS